MNFCLENVNNKMVLNLYVQFLKCCLIKIERLFYKFYIFGIIYLIFTSKFH